MGRFPVIWQTLDMVAALLGPRIRPAKLCAVKSACCALDSAFGRLNQSASLPRPLQPIPGQQGARRSMRPRTELGPGAFCPSVRRETVLLGSARVNGGITFCTAPPLIAYRRRSSRLDPQKGQVHCPESEFSPRVCREGGAE